MTAPTVSSTPAVSTSRATQLQAYLSRIGCSGSQDTSLQTLSTLHRRHVASIPFENLDVLLGLPIRFDPDSLSQKLVAQGRGGYCFEQNSLFANALREIGFRVTPMLARVRWQAPQDLVTPLSHMILKVDTAEGAYLADVGFGGIGLIEPIAIDSPEIQHQAYEPRRIIKNETSLTQQVYLKESWHDLYQFEPKLAHPIDLEIGNWFSFTHPQARFKRNLLVALADDHKRILVNNNSLTTRMHGKEPVTRQIATYHDLIDTLAREFGLEFPADTRFDCPELGIS